METNRNLSWLCINKYQPENNIIKETPLKSGVAFFNLHRMEKGYFPTRKMKHKKIFHILQTRTLGLGTATIQ